MNVTKYTKKDKEKIISSLKEKRIVAMAIDGEYELVAIANKENEERIVKISGQRVDLVFDNSDDFDKYLWDITYYKREYMLENLDNNYVFVVRLSNFKDFDSDYYNVKVAKDEFVKDIIKEVGPIVSSKINILEMEKKDKELGIDIVEEKIDKKEEEIVVSLLEDIEVISK